MNNDLIEAFEDCELEGNHIKTPARLLDRDTFSEMKKILVNNGGKWKGGKIFGFTFDYDPKKLLENLRNGIEENKKKKFQEFFTPPELADRMAQEAYHHFEERQHLWIQEPSAGIGSILDAIFKEMPAGMHTIDAIEIDELKVEYLKAKGWEAIQTDYMARMTTRKYNIILANPPFAKHQYCDHIKKMYSELAPGGIIKAVAPTGFTFASRGKGLQFRLWMDTVKGEYEELPEGTFKSAGTKIQTVLITITKPPTKYENTEFRAKREKAHV